MAGSSFFALFDDIATILDDVATMTKVATKKTAGVLGDDLALNAQQVSGIRADRELPVVWAVAKGSAVNKLILIPTALAISAFAPVLVKPLLMVGGAYLCFEGAHKILHKLLHPEDRHAEEHSAAVQDEAVDLVALEKEKIRGAIRTDFILSAEIIVIALGTVAEASLGLRIGVLAAIGVLMTLGVYGLVAGIVKLDDAGVRLTKSKQGLAKATGKAILAFAPWLMRSLSFLGTAAMFMVGGSIVVHNLPFLHHWVESVSHGFPATGMVAMILETLAGLLLGAALALAAEGFVRKRKNPTSKAAAAPAPLPKTEEDQP
ncbi:MAG: DUF808 domain-containing protein [Fimbriimonadaceae bacterium]|nr:DUF808 domain-containing protein [Fimbriimonadaceae bacterium]